MQREEQKERLNKAFKEAYAALNKAQKEAVDAIEGPVMVIAGPGTGKTQILTLRIANILRMTQVRPENILALTFTESGAKAMRERLHRYVGAASYKVAIFTFHAFAQHQIGNHPDAYPRIIGGTPATDLQKISIIESILQSPDIKLLRPLGNTSYYVSPVLRIISELKKEYITQDTFAQIIQNQERELLSIEQFHQKGAHKGKVRGEYSKKEGIIAKNKELLWVYRQYESLLQEERLYDFEDMIVETITALETNESMLRDLQETYQYVLADEHQDVNGSQNRILELLCSFHENPNIFVVGDEKQSIYRFQGASLENFLYFDDVFKNTKTIALTDNYRSGQVILDAAHSLVAVQEGPLHDLRVPLQAKVVKESTVEFRTFAHQAIEDSWVCKKIRECVDGGIPMEEIAVIVRTNKEVETFATLLRKEGLSVVASADGDILDHPIMQVVTNFIEALSVPENEGALFSLLHGAFWGISADDLIRIARNVSYQTPLFALLCDREKLASIGVTHVDAALNITQTLVKAKEMSTTEAPHRVLEFMLKESGFLDYVMAHDPLEGSRVVRRLYDEIEEMVLKDRAGTLSDVSAVFALRRTYRLPLGAPYITTNSHAVQVMTAHKSKGLEFETVFIPHLTDNLWGGNKGHTYFTIPLTKHLDAELFDELDDERRLLFVALTRAKKHLALSYAQTNTEGRQLLPSRLYDSLDQTCVTVQETESENEAFDPLLSLGMQSYKAPINANLFLQHLSEKGLSATALNNYLHSPWDYVYRNVLRIPQTQELPLQYGTAIHGVMEWVSALYASAHTMPKASEIKDALTRELSKLPLNHADFARLHQKGFEALVVYTEHIAKQMPENSKVEFSVRTFLETGLPELPLLTLTGKLDRLDLDTEGNVTLVVDYKTGKPKTRNDIEGKTKASNGDYKRQLTFYALLLSLYEDEKYACNKGRLSFIEPDAKGVIHEEEFVITPEEIDALKTEIIRVVKEIINGTFLTQECDEQTSEYCHLARMLQLMSH